MPSDSYYLSFALRRRTELFRTLGLLVLLEKSVMTRATEEDGLVHVVSACLHSRGQGELDGDIVAVVSCLSSTRSSLVAGMSFCYWAGRAVCRLGQSGDVNRTPAPLVLPYTEEEQDREE